MYNSRARDKKLEETRILITGANGFVGRHLVARLLHASAVGTPTTNAEAGQAGVDDARTGRVQITAAVHVDHVAAMQREPEAAFDEAGWAGGAAGGRIEIVGMELEDAESLSRLTAAARPRQIYHLAARASGADSDREAVFAANVTGTRNLLEAAASLPVFPRVLLASTGYVYGNTDRERPARETDPLGPLWRFGAYTDSKIEMETMARAYRGFVITARAFAHTGPGQAAAYAVPAFVRQITRMERGLDPPLLRVGNLDARRDLLDARDVVRAYVLLMEHAQPGEAYNISTGKPIQMRQTVERLIRLSAAQPEIVIDPARVRPLDIACSTGDPARTEALSGWQPAYTLDDTLQAMLHYWREHARE